MKMKSVRGQLFVAGLALSGVALVAQGCGDENSLVGGSCAAGYVECDGHCIVGPCTTDGSNDGSADGTTDGSNPDGSSPDGSNLDGADDGSLTDGSNADACPPPPYTTPANCGACGVVCVAPNSACRLDVNNLFVCQPPCTAPQVDCNGVCVDTQTDPFNCGTCGKFCPSNICAGGLCQGATPGDIVVIGHDFRNAPSGSSQAKLLSNAVFIPTSNPLRVLSYEQFAEAAAVTQAKALIQSAAAGRTINYTVSNAAASLQANDLVAKFDVVLIYDQVNGTAAALDPIGTNAAAPLNTFAKGGGVIVALDGASGQGAMPTFLTNAGLLDVPTHATLPAGSLVRISATGDKVGSLVIGPYGTFDRSATFQPNEPNGGNVIYVAQQLVGGIPSDPVVIHKVVP